MYKNIVFNLINSGLIWWMLNMNSTMFIRSLLQFSFVELIDHEIFLIKYNCKNLWHNLIHTISDTMSPTPCLPHHLCHTISPTPCLPHHLSHTISATPSLPHHVSHTISDTPSLPQHHRRTNLYILAPDPSIQLWTRIWTSYPSISSSLIQPFDSLQRICSCIPSDRCTFHQDVYYIS